MSANASMTLYRTSVGKKIAMAVTGLLIVAWLFMHMVGNLLIFAGPEAINSYGEFLQHGSHGAIWVVRAVLLLAIIVHIAAVLSLIRQARAARPVAYEGGRQNQATDAAALSMRYGGLALFLYIIFHLLHMTTGTLHPDFVRGDVYHNVVTAFHDWKNVAIYLIALIFLGLHLYHGVFSGFQTLGWDNARFRSWRKPFALGTALVICVGFSLPPLAVAIGIVH